MKSNELNSIETLLEIKFQERQRVFAKFASVEAKLRDDLAKLDRMAKASEESGHTQMKAIGADVVWQAWLGRTRTSLNIELAQALAQKEAMKGRVKKDYGKLLACRGLLGKARKQANKAAQTKRLSQTMEQQVVKSTSGR